MEFPPNKHNLYIAKPNHNYCISLWTLYFGFIHFSQHSVTLNTLCDKGCNHQHSNNKEEVWNASFAYFQTHLLVSYNQSKRCCCTIPKEKPIRLAPQNHNQLSLWNFYPLYAYKQHSSHQCRSCNDSWKEGKSMLQMSIRRKIKSLLQKENDACCMQHVVFLQNNCK